MQFRRIIILACLAIGVFSCRKDEKDPATDTTTDYTIPENSIATDASLQMEASTVSLTDSLELLADSNDASSTSNALALATRTSSSNTTVTKSCVESGDKAVVTLTQDKDRNLVVKGPIRTATRTVTGVSTLIRTWEKDGSDINCSGKHANIDWSSDITGLKLNVSIDRSRIVNASIVNSRKGTTTTADHEFTVSGTRDITWDSQSSDTSAGTITRVKTVESDVTRTHTSKNSLGQDRDLKFTIANKENEAIVVNVVRDSSDLSLQSKTLVSGTLVATRENDGRTETTYSNLKVVFGSSTCYFDSGSAVLKVFKDAETTAEATYTFTATGSGDYTVTDSDGNSVTGFDPEDCDYEDFAEN